MPRGFTVVCAPLYGFTPYPRATGAAPRAPGACVYVRVYARGVWRLESGVCSLSQSPIYFIECTRVV